MSRSVPSVAPFHSSINAHMSFIMYFSLSAKAFTSIKFTHNRKSYPLWPSSTNTTLLVQRAVLARTTTPASTNAYISLLTQARLSGGRGVGFWRASAPGFIFKLNGKLGTNPTSCYLQASCASYGNSWERKRPHISLGATPNSTP